MPVFLGMVAVGTNVITPAPTPHPPPPPKENLPHQTGNNRKQADFNTRVLERTYPTSVLFPAPIRFGLRSTSDSFGRGIGDYKP